MCAFVTHSINELPDEVHKLAKNHAIVKTTLTGGRRHFDRQRSAARGQHCHRAPYFLKRIKCRKYAEIGVVLQQSDDMRV